MWKQLTAHGPHKWAMPTDEFLERRLVPGSDELREQIGVGNASIRNANDRMEQR
jgi:hypothetical protein